MPFLVLENVEKHFGGLVAVNDVSFSIQKGEKLGLIGPNGAGKTTLFNLIAGMYHPDSGRIMFKGENIAGLRSNRICRKGIGRTFQIPRPFGNISVLDNVKVGIIYGGGKKDQTKDALSLLEFVGLEKKANSSAKDLSLLEKKSLELARALATDPELLLLDETAAGLNPAEIDGMKDLIGRISKIGITTIIVEHIMRFVMGVCQRIIVMNEGKIIADGAQKEVSQDEQVIKAYLGKEYV
jgi:branched-chain amino acid transport system ATP-binding protein